MADTFATHPCRSCPYRVDVPVKTWHREEFENLLANDADERNGGVFGCHRFRLRPQEAEVCAGWFLDQQRRGFPSIKLRLVLMRLSEQPVVTDGGCQLYSTMKKMCRANGVCRARLRPVGP